jgi:hypothetical protein
MGECIDSGDWGRQRLGTGVSWPAVSCPLAGAAGVVAIFTGAVPKAVLPAKPIYVAKSLVRAAKPVDSSQ